MLLQAWLFIGAVAALTTGAALWTADDSIAILTGVIGFISWGLWAYGALNLQIVRDATTYTYTQPEVALLGVALAIVPGFVALNGPVEMMARYRDVRHEEV